MKSEPKNAGRIVAAVVLLVVLGVAGSLGFGPTYRVWERQKAGEAELAQAESNRRIAVLEAEAKLDSAKALAAAEIERAKGVAEANKIIGESLRGNESYLHYLWIQQLEDSNTSVVYVPTEANLPITEAGRLRSEPALEMPR